MFRQLVKRLRPRFTMRTMFVLVVIVGAIFTGWHPTVREAQRLNLLHDGRQRHSAVFPFVIRKGRFINWGLDHFEGKFALTADEQVSYSIWVGVSWELPWPQYVREDGGAVQEFLEDFVDSYVPVAPEVLNTPLVVPTPPAPAGSAD